MAYTANGVTDDDNNHNNNNNNKTLEVSLGNVREFRRLLPSSFLRESAHIIVSTTVWVGFVKPLFPLGLRGCVSSLPFTLYSFGRELTPDFAGAAACFIL
ncbi:hypothetical protein EYF80_047082 [Liparis tanakae]|uniref:Uncharacterized protein n=1 Tax=Liparis tanakae TaxID=230148 RepID=A0A4Z2FQU5_9TELE|nr:hypothetical protein EYF80_047082 [Liparis tanakae]